MEVYDLKSMKREESVCSPLSVALGNFDGVHAGHAELIRKTVEYAEKNGCIPALFTFADGTGVIPNKPGVPCITTTREKLGLMAELGIKYAILEDFNAVRGLTPYQFVKEVLIDRLNARCAVCGYNFRFGSGGTGSADTLCELMLPHDCIIVPQVIVGDIPVSSTAIRELIKAGDMEKAAELLGHAFFFDAEVVFGKQLGHTIGFPTINQCFPEGHIIPKHGIYACKVIVDGTSHLGVANVGTRPTIENDDHRINCETHIIDYNDSLYGKMIRTVFYKRLRDEMRFSSVDELRRRIELDKKAASDYFQSNK